MDRPTLEVADVFRQHGDAYRAQAGGSLSTAERRVMTAIEACRTAALGGHVEQCDRCGHQRVWYNSCRNRHCPTCQSLARAAWIDARRADLLPVDYFHVVFTVPPAVAAIAYQNKAVVYGLLFRAVAETLRTIAADPRHLGAQIGFFAVLHTWGQTLVHHPHLHCVVPGGGLSPDGTQWVSCRPGFFLPVRVLSRLVRRLLLDAVCEAFETGQVHFAGTLDALNDRQHFAAHLQPARQTVELRVRRQAPRRAADRRADPVTQRATTIWERWDGQRPDGSFQSSGMNSFNHYAYGAVGDWMYQTVAGLDTDPERFGYRHLRIQSRPGGGLTATRAALKTMYSRIESAWTLADDRPTLAAIIPPHATATVRILYAAIVDVTEGGQPIEAVDGVTAAGVGGWR